MNERPESKTMKTITIDDFSSWAGSGQLRAGIALKRAGYRTQAYLGFQGGDHMYRLRDGRVARVDLVCNRAVIA